MLCVHIWLLLLSVNTNFESYSDYWCFNVSIQTESDNEKLTVHYLYNDYTENSTRINLTCTCKLMYILS